MALVNRGGYKVLKVIVSRHDTSPHLSNQGLGLRESVERGERELLSLLTLPSG